MTALDVVVMAAGKGTRMKSRLPKVLHRLAGRPLMAHVLEAALALQPRQLVVVTGFGAEQVEKATGKGPVGKTEIAFALQEPQLGTGHAVQQAAPLLADDGMTLILNGDVPLIEPATLRRLVQACNGKCLALLTVVLPDPAGYGRIVRDGDNVLRIVEHRDALHDERAIREVYTGVMAVPNAKLKEWLPKLSNGNAQQEYYLTDLVELAVAEGTSVMAVQVEDRLQVEGINSPVQLAQMERSLQLRKALALMEQGVRIADPARIDLRGTLDCGTDVEIDVNCIFEGSVSLGDGVRIGANCVICDARIGRGAVIRPYTHIEGGREGVNVGTDSLIGPFARLRPGTKLGPDVHIGNFVEVKSSTLGKGSKANHLAYIGDSQFGERVNYGAGAITANYDGANKHTTVVEDDVHIGSNSVLIAPVKIGKGGTVGGGSVVSKDTAEGALTVSRARQASIGGWKRPEKKK